MCNGLVLGSVEIRVGEFFVCMRGLGFLKILGAEEGADVLGVEWESHLEYDIVIEGVQLWFKFQNRWQTTLTL